MSETKKEQHADMPFEAAMERLEAVVRRLEAGDVPLEEAIELYQEGVSLSRLCGAKLDSIEHKVTQLMEEQGKAVQKPFPFEGGGE